MASVKSTQLHLVAKSTAAKKMRATASATITASARLSKPVSPPIINNWLYHYWLMAMLCYCTNRVLMRELGQIKDETSTGGGGGSGAGVKFGFLPPELVPHSRKPDSTSAQAKAINNVSATAIHQDWSDIYGKLGSKEDKGDDRKCVGANCATTPSSSEANGQNNGPGQTRHKVRSDNGAALRGSSGSAPEMFMPTGFLHLDLHLESTTLSGQDDRGKSKQNLKAGKRAFRKPLKGVDGAEIAGRAWHLIRCKNWTFIELNYKQLHCVLGNCVHSAELFAQSLTNESTTFEATETRRDSDAELERASDGAFLASAVTTVNTSTAGRNIRSIACHLCRRCRRHQRACACLKIDILDSDVDAASETFGALLALPTAGADQGEGAKIARCASQMQAELGCGKCTTGSATKLTGKNNENSSGDDDGDDNNNNNNSGRDLQRPDLRSIERLAALEAYGDERWRCPCPCCCSLTGPWIKLDQPKLYTEPDSTNRVPDVSIGATVRESSARRKYLPRWRCGPSEFRELREKSSRDAGGGGGIKSTASSSVIICYSAAHNSSSNNNTNIQAKTNTISQSNGNNNINQSELASCFCLPRTIFLVEPLLCRQNFGVKSSVEAVQEEELFDRQQESLNAKKELRPEASRAINHLARSKSSETNKASRSETRRITIKLVAQNRYLPRVVVPVSNSADKSSDGPFSAAAINSVKPKLEPTSPARPSFRDRNAPRRTKRQLSLGQQSASNFAGPVSGAGAGGGSGGSTGASSLVVGSSANDDMNEQLVELLAQFYVHKRILERQIDEAIKRHRAAKKLQSNQVEPVTRDNDYEQRQQQQPTTKKHQTFNSKTESKSNLSIAPLRNRSNLSADSSQEQQNELNSKTASEEERERAEREEKQEEIELRKSLKMLLGANEDGLMDWLSFSKKNFDSLKNVSLEFVTERPNRTINICPDGPKILLMSNSTDVAYCYTHDQWIERLWSGMKLSPFHYPIILLNILIFLIGTTGNIFVCLSVKRNHQLRNVTNYFIVNLAFADFLVILICLPATVVWDLSLTWFFDTIPCKLIMFLQDVSISVSVLTLTAISIDRYYAICHPFRFKSNLSQAKRTIVLIWLVSFVIMTPDLIYLHAKPSEDLSEAGLNTVLYSDCNYSWSTEASRAFQFVKTILLYLIPFLLMFCTHYRILRVLRLASSMMEHTSFGNNSFSTSARCSRASVPAEPEANVYKVAPVREAVAAGVARDAADDATVSQVGDLRPTSSSSADARTGSDDTRCDTGGHEESSGAGDDKSGEPITNGRQQELQAGAPARVGPNETAATKRAGHRCRKHQHTSRHRQAKHKRRTSEQSCDHGNLGDGQEIEAATEDSKTESNQHGTDTDQSHQCRHHKHHHHHHHHHHRHHRHHHHSHQAHGRAHRASVPSDSTSGSRRLALEPLNRNLCDTIDEHNCTSIDQVHSSRGVSLESTSQSNATNCTSPSTTDEITTTTSAAIKWRSLSGINLFCSAPLKAKHHNTTAGDQDDCCCSNHSLLTTGSHLGSRQVHFDGLAGGCASAAAAKNVCTYKKHQARNQSQHQDSLAAAEDGSSTTMLASEEGDELGELHEDAHATRETCNSCLLGIKNLKRRGQGGKLGTGPSGSHLCKIGATNRLDVKDYIKRQKLLQGLLLGRDKFADTCYSSAESRPVTPQQSTEPAAAISGTPPPADETELPPSKINLSIISSYLARPIKKAAKSGGQAPSLEADLNKQAATVDEEDNKGGGSRKLQLNGLANESNKSKPATAAVLISSPLDEDSRKRLVARASSEPHVIEMINSDINMNDNGQNGCGDNLRVTGKKLATSKLISTGKSGRTEHHLVDDTNEGCATGRLIKGAAAKKVKAPKTKTKAAAKTTATTTKIPIPMATFNADSTANVFILTMHNKSKLESRRKAAKMLTAIVVLFGICYLPVHLINFLRQFIDDIPQTDVTSTISMLAHCICYLNSAINPIIYNHMNSVFRSEFRKFLSCLDCRQAAPNGNKSTKTRPPPVWNGTSGGGGGAPVFANHFNFNNSHNFDSIVSINKKPTANGKRSLSMVA